MNRGVLYPLRKLHGAIHEMSALRKKKKEIKEFYLGLVKAQLEKYSKCVFLVLTPEHTNLGDHAIASVESSYLNELKIGYVEITGAKLNILKRYDMLNIMNGYPILINGGGNLGTLWFDVESVMRKIVTENKKSPIMILPNTIYYEESAWGMSEMENSKKIYNNHKKLRMYAREKTSFEYMKAIYNNVKLIPDLVLDLNESNFNNSRSGCLLCLRKDCEKTLAQNSELLLTDQIQDIFGCNYKYTDTIDSSPVSIEKRMVALDKKFTEFRSSELVITDRLHGMIFAAITGTPCIVINSKSPKVKGCYEWIKNLDYIRFADDVSQVKDLFAAIPKCQHKYNNEHLKSYYDELKQDILKVVEGK